MTDNDKYLNFDSDGDGELDSHIDFNNDYSDNVSDLWLIDEDGDGIADDFMTIDDDNVYTETFDTNGDGIDDVSLFSLDLNEDGIIDAQVTEIDLDGDKMADIISYDADLNFDGDIDFSEVQFIGEDNSADDIIITAADTDFDGNIDLYHSTTDEDILLDSKDATEPAEIIEPVSYEDPNVVPVTVIEPVVELSDPEPIYTSTPDDFDGDGDVDGYVHTADFNADGIVDSVTVEVDVDDDGDIDVLTFEEDTNGDGVADIGMERYVSEDRTTDYVVRYTDTDGDGVYDQYTTGEETSFYHTPEDIDTPTVPASPAVEEIDVETEPAYITEEVDIDGDGDVDALVYTADYDGDGVVDAGEMRFVSEDRTTDYVVRYADTDGDGKIDEYSTSVEESFFYTPASLNPQEPTVVPVVETEPVVDTEPSDVVYTIDTDGNGTDDTIVHEIDSDKDGQIDMVAYENDSDGNGVIDTVFVEADTDGDGVVDTTYAAVDYNEDGIADESAMATASDTDGDGQVDTIVYQYDTDGDGEFDATETESIFSEEPTVETEPVVEPVVETEPIVEPAVETEPVPSENSYVVDADGDGSDDTIVHEIDNNNDGQIDTVVYEMDTDNDGVIDTVVADLDTDGDGIIDEEYISVDHNGDGIVDESSEAFLVDTDGDGKADAAVYQYDTDGDGVFDEEHIEDIQLDDDTHATEEDDDSVYIPVLDVSEYDTYNDNGTWASDLDNFDPGKADPDAIIGNPEEVLDLWESQGNTGRCAIYAQKFVIEEFTGEELDIEELCDIAEAEGWFTEESGSSVYGMDKLLDRYGVPNETSYENDIHDLEEALAEGNKVIVAVDSGEYWHGENDYDYTPGDGADHAVEVIGIDNSDPENPMVILNDSGNPDGRGCMVPLDTFMDAWEDSNNYMVECIM